MLGETLLQSFLNIISTQRCLPLVRAVRMSRPPVLKRHEAAMNANPAMNGLTTPQAAEQSKVLPTLKREREVSEPKNVEEQLKQVAKKLKTWLDRPKISKDDQDDEQLSDPIVSDPIDLAVMTLAMAR
jgi:hypothetical protein